MFVPGVSEPLQANSSAIVQILIAGKSCKSSEFAMSVAKGAPENRARNDANALWDERIREDWAAANRSSAKRESGDKASTDTGKKMQEWGAQRMGQSVGMRTQVGHGVKQREDSWL